MQMAEQRESSGSGGEQSNESTTEGEARDATEEEKKQE
jgi:hypothetical protein